MTKKTEVSTLAQRKQNEDELERLVTSWTMNLTAYQVESILQSAGVAANIVEKSSDVYDDAQLKYRNYFVRLPHPVMGKQAFEPQADYILSKAPREVTKPAPCLGEHNQYVFTDLLGMSDDEVASHIIDGSITTELEGVFKANM